MWKSDHARSFGEDPGSSRNIGHHHDIWSEYRTLADCDRGKDDRARSHFDAVLEVRALVEGFCSSIPRSDRGIVPDKTVVADDGFPVKHQTILVRQQ